MDLKPGTAPWFIHRVGAGARSARDLRPEESERAARELLNRRWTPAQEAAFLLGMRVKGETDEELTAFVRAVREGIAPLPSLPPGLLDVPAYAGKARTFHALAGASILAAASGVPVLLHGSREAPRSGLSPLLAALELPADPTPGEAASLLRRHGWAYLDVARFHPGLHRLLALRSEMGVRSLFHAAVKASNPGRAGRHLVGISHAPYFARQAGVLRALGAERALLLQGSEGESEVSLTGATPTCLFAGETRREESWAPERWGFRRCAPEALALGTPKEEARWTLAALGGEESPRLHAVLLTAAAMRLAAGVSASLPEALERVRTTLASPAPRRLVEGLRAAPRATAGKGTRGGRASSRRSR